MANSVVMANHSRKLWQMERWSSMLAKLRRGWLLKFFWLFKNKNL